MPSEVISVPKMSPQVFTLFSPGIVTEFLSVSLHTHRVRYASAVSGAPGELREGVVQASWSEFCFVFSLNPIPSNDGSH